MRRTGVPAALLAAAITCGACERGPEPTSRELLEDGTFLTLDRERITLSGGAGVADGVRRELVMTAEGDLDFDSETDAAALLVAEEGRARFLTLHALLRDGRRVEDVSARLIGDRVEVRRMTIADGTIRVDLRIRAHGEPITVSPSVDISRHFVLSTRGVIPIRRTEVVEDATRTEAGNGADGGGGPEPGTLHGYEWILESLEVGDWTADLGSRGEPVALRFLPEVYDGTTVTGQVSGFTGCNVLYGSFRTQASVALRFSGLGTTRRRCRGRSAELEQRLIEALDAAQTFGLSGDQAVLPLVDGVIRLRRGGRVVAATAAPVDVRPEGGEERTG